MLNKFICVYYIEWGGDQMVLGYERETNEKADLILGQVVFLMILVYCKHFQNIVSLKTLFIVNEEWVIVRSNYVLSCMKNQFAKNDVDGTLHML